MLPEAIKAGLAIPEFWDLTYQEIIVYVKAVNEEKLEDMRVQARMIHTLGGLVGLAAWGDKPYPDVSEVFPGLFEPEETREEPLAAQMERDKWLAYAEGFNLKRREVSK